MKTSCLAMIVSASLMLAGADYALAQIQMPPPSPPAGLYPHTSKIFSVFQVEPETLHPNDTASVQVLVTNNAGYPLHDVAIGQFSNDSKDITIYHLQKIDTLGPNQTGKILGTLHVFAGLMPANYNDIWWTVTARNQTGTVAESMEFHRNLAIMESPPLSCCGTIVTVALDPPLQQLKSGTAIQDIMCDNMGEMQTYLFLRTENHYPVCVTSDTADKLSSRGFIETNQTVINQFVLKKAREFVMSSPTFEKFGVRGILLLDLKTCDLIVPQSCYPHAYFQVNGTGVYGNGTGSIPMTATKTPYHVMSMTILDMDKVQCAVVDGIWDEKNQKPLNKNDSLCGTWYGYKDGTG